MVAKKSKYKSVLIKKKRYYFYKITWADITGDSSHADLHTAEGMMPSIMVTHAYVLNRDKKNISVDIKKTVLEIQKLISSEEIIGN